MGGLGALFFLGTLGAIAIYVQRQSAEQDLELPRTAATAVAPAPEPTVVPPLPWLDRLDLEAATFAAYASADAAPAPDPANRPNSDKGTSSDKPTAAKPTGEGRLVQELNDGHRIMFTIDPVLQDSMLQLFRKREVPYAAAVMLDVRDNAVLVMAGHSSMDPQVDPMEVVATAWAPAASVFKLVTTAALIDSGVATAATRVCFNGGLHGITDDELRDDPVRDTQCETLAEAVAKSYNLVIGKLALAHLDQEALIAVAKRFGFETDIPFELNVERSPAHIPTDPKERARVAAGFWSIDMSPIHGAMLASTFARGGMTQPPHVIAQVLGPDGTDLTPALPKAERVIPRDVAEAINVMMEQTTNTGTARASFRDEQGNPYIQGVRVAGKTGSLTGKRAPSLNYNWFVGFAPADRPEVAFAVLLANEPAWRIKAHYAARRLVQLYLERRDAIARARDARLTPTGVVLPARDASGALVATVPALPSVSADASAVATAPGAPTPAPSGPASPTEAPPALPSVSPSIVPTEPPRPEDRPPVAPADDALPPVPGSVPKPETTSPLGG